MKMKKSVGDWNWIDDFLKKKGWTKKELAIYLGVTTAAINNWIRGRNDPRYPTGARLARLVGSHEELEQLSGINIGIEPPDAPQSFSPLDTSWDTELVKNITDVMKYTGRFKDLHAYTSKVLREAAGMDASIKARFSFDKGYAELMLGRPLEAVESLDKARKMLPPNGDSMLLADLHWLTGECLRVIGKLNDAEPNLEESGKIYKRLDAKPSISQPGPLWLEWDLGRLDVAKGRYERAENHFERMEQMARAIRLVEAEIIASWSQGDLDEIKGNFDKALTSLLYARNLAGAVQDKYWEAGSAWSVAKLLRKTSDHEGVLTQAQYVRDAFESIGNKRMVAKANCVLADLYSQTGRLEEAEKLYLSAVDVFTETEDIPMERSTLLALGLARLAKESRKPNPDYQKVFQEDFLGLDANRPNNYDPFQEVYEHLAFGEVLRLTGNTSRAFDRFHSALLMSNMNGFKLEKGHALMGMAATKLMEGNIDRQSCYEAINIYRSQKSKWGEAQALKTLALIELETGGDASDLLQRSFIKSQEISFDGERPIIENPVVEKQTAKQRQIFLFV